MALEDVTYINDLVVTNPEPTDKRREGDDHLRNIKKALKNTFPSLNGAVSVSPPELNVLNGIDTGTVLETRLDAKLEASDLPDLSPYAEKAVENTWTKVQSHGVVNLGSVSGAVAVDADAGACFKMTLTGNITGLSVSNMQEGQELTLKFIQGGAGGYTIVPSSDFHFAEGIQPVPSSAVGAYDVWAGKVIDGKVVVGGLRGLASV